MSLKYSENNIVLAKDLRKNSTPQENRLWYDFYQNTSSDFNVKKQLTLLQLISIATKKSLLQKQMAHNTIQKKAEKKMSFARKCLKDTI